MEILYIPTHGTNSSQVHKMTQCKDPVGPNANGELSLLYDPTPKKKMKQSKKYLSEKNTITCFKFGDGMKNLTFSIRVPKDLAKKKLWWNVEELGPMLNGCFVSGDEVHFVLGDYDIRITAARKRK
jgi:hypothetical protein